MFTEIHKTSMFNQFIFRFTQNLNVYKCMKLVIKFKYYINLCKYYVYNHNYYCVEN